MKVRAFTPKMARTAYERQKGICPKCGKPTTLPRGAKAARLSLETAKCFVQIATVARATYKHQVFPLLVASVWNVEFCRMILLVKFRRV